VSQRRRSEWLERKLRTEARLRDLREALGLPPPPRPSREELRRRFDDLLDAQRRRDQDSPPPF
jgi:hypothetical protein